MIPNPLYTNLLAALTNLGQLPNLGAALSQKSSLDTLKAQILVKNMESAPLDLSSKKSESDPSTTSDFTTKIEEIDSDCGDTRVSV